MDDQHWNATLTNDESKIVEPDPRANDFVPPASSQALDLPAGMKPILLVVVDTEENFDWSIPYSSSSTAVHGMQRIGKLQSIFDKFGVRPIYLIDYAIASQAEGYRPLTDIVATRRCEIGAHLHPWINPPIAEEISAHNSYPFNLPPALEAEKLRTLTTTIETNLGMRPVSYKAGRYGIGAATPQILLDQGYQVDLSVVPTRDYSLDGGPDFRAFRGVTPFWIDNERRLLELPFTTAFIGALYRLAGPIFRLLDSKAGRILHLPGIFARLGLVNQVNLTPEGVTIKEAKALTRHLLAKGDRIFTLAFHSTSLTPGSTPYVRDERQLAQFYRWLEEYFTFFSNEVGGSFMTPRDLYKSFQTDEAVGFPAAENEAAFS